MLVIYYEYQLQDANVKVSRVLPRPTWIESNIEIMSKMDTLLTAAKDRKIAFHEERTVRPQNSSHHSSLPGMDVLPAAAKDREFTFHEEKTAGPQNNSQRSPLPATKYPIYFFDEKKTLPVASAKNQKLKSASHKKKQPRGNYISSDQGYEWGMCDKDCGWCGRCIENNGHLL